MKPLLKWILFGFAALLLLAVALVVAVVTLVDPARYRVIATDAVQQATGRTLTLGGDVGLKLLPCCAVEFDQATLGNPPGFGGEPFLHIESAELAIRLWPLLSRREVAIGTVRLDGLKANLTGRKDGSNNWTFSDAADVPEVDGNDGGGDAIAGISVAGISVRDASIDYSDEADGSRYRIEQLQLTTSPLRGTAPFDLNAFLRFSDLSDNSGGAIALKATTRVAVAGDVTSVKLSDLDGELDLKDLGGLDTVTGRLRSPELDVRMASDTLLSAPRLTLDLQLTGADLPGGSATLKAGLTDFSYAVDPGTGTISALTATPTLAGISLDVTGAGSFGASNDLRGSVRILAFSPRNLLATLRKDVPDTADPRALTQLSGSANWFLRDKAAGVDKLAIILDDTKIAGSLSQELLPEGSKATPRTRFDLTMDALNADRYLAPDAPPAAKGSDKKTGKAPPREIPAEMLRGLNLEGRARIGRLTLDGMHLADVDVTAKANGGRVQLEPLAARIYGGSFGGAIRLDTTGPKSRLTLDQKVSGVDFGALLTDLADVRNITGTMSLTLDGMAVGSTDDELLENLGGNLAFSLADGVYQGMDVWYEIRKARALLRQTAPPPMSEPEQTQIRALDLTGKISAGKLRTERFNAEIPFLRVSGDTTVDFLGGSLDSQLTALVFEKPVFGDDASLADLEGVRIPLTVSGPVDDPRVRVDLRKMVKGALKETLRDTLLDKLGLGKPVTEVPPAGEESTAEGESAAPAEKKKEDPVKKALDRIFR
ncbi:MAG: AsmA family protein [Gammaproteobacteria bacterium]|nr:AsmA family protein [Gammaproteobacteria bacterium]